MVIKLVGERGTRQQVYECNHISVSKQPEVLTVSLDTGTEIRLPDDGDKVYVMNQNGDTVDSYEHVPERVRRTA